MEDLKSLVKQIAKLERELDKDCIVLLKDIALENKIETKEKIEENKYVIVCPNCKSTFDNTKQMNEWKEEVIKASGILEQIKEINSFLKK